MADRTVTQAVTARVGELVARWSQIPNSMIDAGLPAYCKPANIPVGSGLVRVTDMITEAESGGVADPVGRRFWIPLAGGHNDWYWNLVLRLDVDSGQGWQVDMHGTQPPTDVDGTKGYSVYHDGKPSARHTYAGIQYSPVQDKIWLGSGSRWRSGTSDNWAWLWDCKTKTWSRATDMPKYFIGLHSAYDPVKDEIWFDDNERIRVYSFATNTYRAASVIQATVPIRGAMGIDPVRRYFYVSWKDFPTVLRRYKMDQPTQVKYDLVVLKGDTSVLATYAPGMEWEPRLNQFVVWSGGRTIHLIDPDAATITKISGTGDDPGAYRRNGTFGRFRRMAAGDYVLVNAVKTNCWRLTLEVES